MKRAKSEKYCAAEFVSVIEQRERERRRKRERDRYSLSREWVRAKSTDWLTRYNTQQRRVQQEINKCCNCLCCHLPPTGTTQHWQRRRECERGPCKDSSDIVPQCASIHLGPLATRLWQAFLCFIGQHFASNLAASSLNFLPTLCTCNAITFLINQIAASYANLALCGAAWRGPRGVCLILINIKCPS